MAKTRKADQDRIWWVTHPDHTEAVVRAPNWEQATVEAARWWEVPWREVAALCECGRVEKLVHNVCLDCGTVFHGEGLRCTRCELAARDAELNRKARNRRYYREMMPPAAGRKETGQ